jgi:hypothetical protein
MVDHECLQRVRGDYSAQISALRSDNDSMEEEVQSLRKKLHSVLNEVPQCQS